MSTFTRSKFAHEETISFDSGRGKIGFFTPNSPYFGIQETPHDNLWSDGTPSFLPPISHYHLLQQETFYVAQGSGEWTLNGTKTRLSKGDSITIPAMAPHRFESIPNAAQEPLVVWHKYDPQRWEMEERFSRNTACYMWDCHRAGVEPSLFQLCVFAANAWVVAEVFRFPFRFLGDVYVEVLVNSILTWIMAAIGLLLGYKKSYIEYYDPVWSARRNGERKDK